ncbi:MAG TPA: DoxX family protein [Magnetospirillaceae bacterium]|nr:DoxX family protein [Magnetospirillaceae bacterium]
METPAPIVRLLGHPAVLLATRICVTLPFLVGGLVKLADWQGGIEEMHALGLEPAWAVNLATLLTELVGSALVILNRKTWLGAGALGIFTVLTTFLAHRFWDFQGAERMREFNSFLEHATIAAAFILVTVLSFRTRSDRGIS